MLCVDLQGWNMGGSEREAQEGGDICILIADSCCTCKAITCKFKKIFKLKVSKNKITRDVGWGRKVVPEGGNVCICITDLRASQVALVVKNPLANAGDIRDSGSTPGSRRSPGGGYGNPLQHSFLEQRSLVGCSPWIAKSQTGLMRLSSRAAV